MNLGDEHNDPGVPSEADVMLSILRGMTSWVNMSRPTIIQVHFRVHEFLWDGLIARSHMEARFIGQATGYALALGKQGISLLDEAGVSLQGVRVNLNP
jgi:hypothetical protein